MKNELIVSNGNMSGAMSQNTCERCGETGRAVMAELGIDIACQRSKDLGEFDGQRWISLSPSGSIRRSG
jgi:hypothetical protein